MSSGKPLPSSSRPAQPWREGGFHRVGSAIKYDEHKIVVPEGALGVSINAIVNHWDVKVPLGIWRWRIASDLPLGGVASIFGVKNHEPLKMALLDPSGKPVPLYSPFNKPDTGTLMFRSLKPGTYTLRLRPAEMLGSKGTAYYLDVSYQRARGRQDVEFLGDDVPTVAKTSASLPVNFEVVNTGSESWTPFGPGGAVLVCRWFSENGQELTDRCGEIRVPAEIESGRVYTLTDTFNTLPRHGNYRMRVEMRSWPRPDQPGDDPSLSTMLAQKH